MAKVKNESSASNSVTGKGTKSNSAQGEKASASNSKPAKKKQSSQTNAQALLKNA